MNIHYQQKSKVLYTFTPNRFYTYLLNVEPSNLAFLKTYNTEFDEIITRFTYQSGRPLEIEDKVNLTLLINPNLSGGKFYPHPHPPFGFPLIAQKR